jgi:hypothetical protein
MTPGLAVTLNSFFSLIALLGVALITWDRLSRLKAGPVRFRLPLAWPARTVQVNWLTWYSLIVCSLGLLAMIVVSATASKESVLMRLVLIWFLWGGANSALGSLNPRRDARRWLLVTSGLLNLVLAAVVLAMGLQARQAAENPAAKLDSRLIFFSSVMFLVMLLAMGGGALQESIWGTRLRERGIEMYLTTIPWSRVVVKDWRPREGGFDLTLSIRPPRLFGWAYAGNSNSEVIVPVPASERPALEGFLAGHTATTG